MVEVKMNTSTFAANQQTVSAAGAKLALKLSADDGASNAKTIDDYVALVKKANKAMTKLAAEVQSTSLDLAAIQKTAEAGDAAMAKVVDSGATTPTEISAW